MDETPAHEHLDDLCLEQEQVLRWGKTTPTRVMVCLEPAGQSGTCVFQTFPGTITTGQQP